MKVFNIIRKRRSIRVWSGEAIEEDKLKKLVEAAIWAPSGGNIQAWNIAVVQAKADIEQLKAVSPGMPGEPTALMILCADRRKAADRGSKLGTDVAIMDIAIAAQNVCLEAAELGLGSCMVKSFNQKATMVLLDLPENMTPELMVVLGYPKKIPNPPPRRAMDEVVIRWIKE